ncbi:MAG: sarcosine oxidase [Rhizobiales bacterium PAR1]|nr:MAG: sarcosine oxidase [Rhizobiales bacterium PAR1]
MAGIGRGAPVSIVVDGSPVEAFGGESLAAALLAANIVQLRKSPREGGVRGAFCFMGVCQECAIIVDGTVQQACLVPVHDGMTVTLRGSV